MNFKSNKIQCVLLALMMVFVCATSSIAATTYDGEDHEHFTQSEGISDEDLERIVNVFGQDSTILYEEAIEWIDSGAAIYECGYVFTQPCDLSFEDLANIVNAYQQDSSSLDEE